MRGIEARVSFWEDPHPSVRILPFHPFAFYPLSVLPHFTLSSVRPSAVYSSASAFYHDSNNQFIIIKYCKMQSGRKALLITFSPDLRFALSVVPRILGRPKRRSVFRLQEGKTWERGCLRSWLLDLRPRENNIYVLTRLADGEHVTNFRQIIIRTFGAQNFMKSHLNVVIIN